MQIKTISVTVKQTYNLGNYSNISPSMTITADLDLPNDDPIEWAEILRDRAREQVHEEIDIALEDQGDKPEFYDGPRFTLIPDQDDKIALIVPDELVGELPDPWKNYARSYTAWGGRRLERIQERIDDQYFDWEIVDCACGDLDDSPELRWFDDLPELRWFSVFQDQYAKIIIVMPGLPDDQPKEWTEVLGPTKRARIKENLLNDLIKGQPNYVIIDGETTPLPPLNRLAIFTNYSWDTIIITQPEVPADDLPEAWRASKPAKVIRGTFGDIWAKLRDMDIDGENYIDCTDGDFPRLDEAPPEIEDDYDDDDFEDDEEWF